MAIACPVDLDTLRLRAEVQSIYARVATEPSGSFHFHRGAAYAAGMLGYDADALAALPADTTASFAGVANPHRLAPMLPGATVVDIGCGAGLDLLLAAQAVGSSGRVIGVDMTEAMAERPAIYRGFRIGEVSCPTSYFPEASSINFRRSVTYGLGVLKTAVGFRLACMGFDRGTVFKGLRRRRTFELAEQRAR